MKSKSGFLGIAAADCAHGRAIDDRHKNAITF
jgi:hypothetical protein